LRRLHKNLRLTARGQTVTIVGAELVEERFQTRSRIGTHDLSLTIAAGDGDLCALAAIADGSAQAGNIEIVLAHFRTGIAVSPGFGLPTRLI
jgi:hypothetical protein